MTSKTEPNWLPLCKFESFGPGILSLQSSATLELCQPHNRLAATMSSEESEIARLQEERALKKAAAAKAGDVSLGGRAQMDSDVYGGSKRSDYLTELPAGDGMDVDDENQEDHPQRLLDSCKRFHRFSLRSKADRYPLSYCSKASSKVCPTF